MHVGMEFKLEIKGTDIDISTRQYSPKREIHQKFLIWSPQAPAGRRSGRPSTPSVLLRQFSMK